MTVEELKIVLVADSSKLRQELVKSQTAVTNFKNEITREFTAVQYEFKKTFKNTEKEITSTFSGLGKKLIGIFAGLQIGKFIGKSIKESIMSIEYESLFQVAFGKMSDSMREWTKHVSDALNLNLSDLRKTTAIVYEMTRSMGLGQESALKMARGVSLLSQDLASFYHLQSSEMYHKIISGLMGQTRGLHLLGKAITESTVKEFAYQKGIAQTGSILSEQQKLVARYLLLLDQTRQAQGNLALTMQSPANQMRAFSANLKSLSQTLGNLFIPLLNTVLPYLNAFLKIITMIISAIGKFFGIPTNEEFAKDLHAGTESFYDLNNGAKDFNKNLKKTDDGIKKVQKRLAHFDEMNVLLDKTKMPKLGKIASGGMGFGQPFDFPIEEYNWHEEWVKNKVQSIVSNIQKYFSGINFKPFEDSLNNLKIAIQPIIDDIGKSFTWFMDNILTPLTTWTIGVALPTFFDILSASLRILQPVLEAVGEVFKWWWDNVLHPIANWTGGAFIWVLQQITKWFKLITDNKVAMDVVKDLVQRVTDLAIQFGLLVVGIKAFKLSMSGFQLIMELAINPIGLTVLSILAIATAILLVIKYLPEIKQWFVNVFNTVQEIVGKVATWFKITIKKYFEDPLGGVINSFKWLINTISSTKIKVPSYNNPQYTQADIPLPKYANGGIVNSPTYAQIGESGAEAVVPLERNTGWIDMLASKLNGNGQSINLTVKIGEDNIINRVIDGINNKTMELGRGVVMV